MNLVLDIGNSYTKVALIQQNKIVFQTSYKGIVSIDDLEQLIQKYNVTYGITSSVVKGIGSLAEYLETVLKQHLVLNSDVSLPIALKYKTPKTLGNDRIALAVFGAGTYKNANVLIIDSGTCITYEFVNSEKEYLGGAISPGLNMRFKSLNNFTSNLPLLELDNFNELIGKSTNESIWSGVQHGFIDEVDGMIHRYKAQYEDLKVIITGGDHKFLQTRLKNNTFAHPDALIIGLNHILNYNAKN